MMIESYSESLKMATESEQHESMDERRLRQLLQKYIDNEEEMMRSYLICAERVHTQPELQLKLREFAEGNAKRSRQLMDVLQQLNEGVAIERQS